MAGYTEESLSVSTMVCVAVRSRQNYIVGNYPTVGAAATVRKSIHTSPQHSCKIIDLFACRLRLRSLRRTTNLDLYPSTSIESSLATPKAERRTTFLGDLSSQVQQCKLALPPPLREADFNPHFFRGFGMHLFS